MGKLLDKLKDNLNMIVDQPELNHEEYFMMGMMDPWAAELTTVQDYTDHKLKQKKTKYFNSASTTKTVPLKELGKYLLSTNDQDNK